MRTTIAAMLLVATMVPSHAEELYFPPEMLAEYGYAPPVEPGQSLRLTVTDVHGRTTVITPEALEQIAVLVGAVPPPVQPDGLIACINDQAMVRIDGRRMFFQGDEARRAGC